MTTQTWAPGITITFGWCPGCRALHRTSDCPDDRWAEGEYCPCCEAISGDAALARRRAPGRPFGDGKAAP